MSRGEPWSAEENAATVAAYLAMLEQELAGQRYVKKAYREELVRRFGRSHPAYEMKFSNISAILRSMGAVYISGYKPRGNVQKSLVDEVVTQVRGQRTLTALMDQCVEATAVERADIRWITGSRPSGTLVTVEGYHPHAGLHTDYVAREASNASLGLAGELAVLDRERRTLTEGGRGDLAERVEHVARTKGDGWGYDIHSFDVDGSDRLIEVKTTRRDIEWPMVVSVKEVEASKALADHFVVARVYQFAEDQVGLYELHGAITQTCDITPLNYRALPKPDARVAA